MRYAYIERSILVSLLALLIGVGLWMQFGLLTQKSTGDTNVVRHQPNYFVEQFVASGDDGAGISYILRGTHLEHFPNDGAVHIDEPCLLLIEKGVSSKLVGADVGRVTENNRIIVLSGNVEVIEYSLTNTNESVFRSWNSPSGDTIPIPVITTLLLYPAEITVALDSDRNKPAIVVAQNIEIDFATGRRIYRGDVTIQQGTLTMKAEEVHLFFNDEDLELAIAHGQPAIFEQQLEGNEYLIHGTAKKIEIDQVKNIATFSGNAELRQHRDTITGDTIIYFMETEKMTVQSNVEVPGNPARLSTSGTTKISADNKPHLGNNWSKVVIKPRSEAPLIDSDNAPLQPEVLSTANKTRRELAPQATKDTNIRKDELRSSNTLLEFQAARVIDAGTAVYDGPNQDAELLGGLSGRTPVKVLEVRNNWGRVIIPGGVNVWVFASYVVENNKSGGLIKGRGVRARWKPSTDSRIVGIFKLGERVQVLTTEGNWKQVSLPSVVDTWIPMTQLDTVENINSAWKDEWTKRVEFLSDASH